MSKTKKSVYIITFSLIGVSLICGAVLGSILGERYNPTMVPNANTNQVKRDDLNVIYQRYQSFLGGSDPSSKDFSVNKNFTASDLVNIGIYNFNNSAKALHISEGNSITDGTIKVNQAINTIMIKDGTKYFKERISKSSFVELATRFYNFDLNTNEVYPSEIDVYSGKAVTEKEGTYDSKNLAKFNDLSSFLSAYGISNTEAFVYTICNDSLISSTSIEDKKYQTGVSLVNDTYQITLALDPSKATVDYRKEMLSTTDMDKEDGKVVEPRFVDVALTFVLDRNLNILSYEANESYWVKKLGWNQMKGSAKYKIITNDDSIYIPTLDENLNYDEIWSK